MSDEKGFMMLAYFYQNKPRLVRTEDASGWIR